MALGRAYEATGPVRRGRQRLQWASQRRPGFEAIARYAAFLARHGRRGRKPRPCRGIDKRLAKLTPQFRREARHWRDLAAKALAGG